MAQPKPEDLTPDEIATGVANGGYLIPKRISLTAAADSGPAPPPPPAPLGYTIHDDPALRGKPGQSRGNLLKAERAERAKLNLAIGRRKAASLAVATIIRRVETDPDGQEMKDLVQVAKLDTADTAKGGNTVVVTDQPVQRVKFGDMEITF